MRRLLPWIALVALVGPGAAGAQPPETASADAVAQALQKHYQLIRDFSADFTHVYRGGVLRTEAREHGTVEIKKPGKMRWLYTGPEKKEFVSDGVKIYSYLPADKQVIVADVPSDDVATTSVLFLAGKGDVARDFTATYTQSPVAGTTGLKLTPRRSEPDYDYLVVALDPATLQIRGLVTKDKQGGESTLTFTNLQENRGISDKDFVFRIPRGVDVLTDGTRN
ncbi:MAG TPA: outer membrane lipoprotein carrier protein LolA [Vicinamibacterales bacterium]|nr:outer membrane lipoprotein carrier protein LolA [Vicinamibacterales bacterium]